jgi:hypothetical protein
MMDIVQRLLTKLASTIMEPKDRNAFLRPPHTHS